MTFRGYPILCVALAALLSACQERKTMTWYEESKELDKQREVRVKQFMDQGMTEDAAKQAHDFEQMIKNTELPPNPDAKPLEGYDLQEALHH